MNDLSLWLLMLIIPAIADLYVKINYSKYKNIKNNYKLSGYDVAKKILANNGLDNLYIVETQGTLTDNYDPTRNVVRLSSEVYNDDSIASLAVAAHECGHALQDKDGYFFLKLRCAIYPIVSFANKIAYVVLLLGFILEKMDLIWLAIVLVALGLLFQLITLPVEINASKRAMQQIEKYNLADDRSITGTKHMLISAALTYLAGVISSAIYVLRLILMFTNRRD
jgi:Zn-dependent membrane protease YugP